MADPVSSSDVPEAAVQILASDADNPEPPKKPLPPGLRPYKRVDMPTAEQMASEEFMNNCAVRTVLSAVMGGGLGAMFGLFMGTMDGAVRLSSGGVRAWGAVARGCRPFGGWRGGPPDWAGDRGAAACRHDILAQCRTCTDVCGVAGPGVRPARRDRR